MKYSPFLVAVSVAPLGLAIAAHADPGDMVGMAYSPSTLHIAWVTHHNGTEVGVRSASLNECQSESNSPCTFAGYSAECMIVELVNDQWLVGYGPTRHGAVDGLLDTAHRTFNVPADETVSIPAPDSDAHCAWDVY
jgi:hypothetical protein